MAWRADCQAVEPDGFVFPTASGRARNKDNVSRRVLAPAIKQTNEQRTRRGLSPLPKVTPHALRRTYISLMFEAGAPLPYVMSQVGHADSRTTLEIYAQVQKRLSRTKVHRAFDDLLAAAGAGQEVPTDGRDKMSRLGVPASFSDPETGSPERTETPRGPRKWSTEVN